MFNAVYKDKTVLITGNTGFKGSWLTLWLLKLGANVVGISDEIPTKPSLFDALKIEDKINHYFVDITDLNSVKEIINESKPDFIFHLAAQAIVSTSYSDPIKTITSNVLGTANILEAIRFIDWNCTAIIITSDKCYDNVEWVYGYKETDSMGGKDIYSGSKGAAEIVIKSYFHSFIKQKPNISLAIGRAGNVIGGGDWAKDRIVVDCVSSWSKSKTVDIRCPDATRPWQHVLEPLSGYLLLGSKAANDSSLNGEAFNFGPNPDSNKTVVNLIEDLATNWGFEDLDKAFNISDNLPFHEASLLKLNCDKALFHLNWKANLNYRSTINLISDWYSSYYNKTSVDMEQLTNKQIAFYENEAESKGLSWTKE